MTIMKKTKIGITGQTGFIGTHLYNTLGLNADKYERIAFRDEYFQKEEKIGRASCRERV